jgi:hypothetical protein
MSSAEASGPTTPLRRLFQLGNLVALRSEYQLVNGDEEGAFLGLLRYLELGRRFQRSGEMIDYLIGGAHEVRAIDQILRLSSFPAAGNLDEVARRLGEHAWEPEAMENTLKREYGVVTAGLEEVLGESANWRDAVILRYTHQPHRTRQLFAKSYSAAIHELREDCSAAPRAQEPSKWWYLGPNFGGRGLHAISTGPLPKFISARCGDQMRNGLTRLALALRAYRVDKGRLPENLDALVPEYVPAIPRDLDGQSFRYSARREILYSVGDDRLDGGGGEPTFRVDWSGPDPGVTLSHR